MDLWPEASAEQLRNIFHRAMYYLRQALGSADWSVFADGAYTFNLQMPFRYDVQVFEGSLYFAEAQYGKLGEIYQRILTHDNYLELAHRELMRCYARQGETGQAIRHFQGLRQLLRDELQAEPSPETRLLYERLKRGDDI